MTPSQLLAQLRVLVRETVRARFQGTGGAKFARAQGYADGYMRALLDSGLADMHTLLSLVAEERRTVDTELAA